MTEEMQYVINSPYTSYWLRNAIQELLKTDALDARSDAKLLFNLFDDRLNEMLDKHRSV
jgi:hypothetical protein